MTTTESSAPPGGFDAASASSAAVPASSAAVPASAEAAFTSPAAESSAGAPASSAGAPPRPPSLSDVAWTAGITAVKATVVALAVDAFVNSNAPRFQGKAMKVRALGYAGGLLVVPLAWRALGRQQPYPRELDMLVALPLLADAGGNAVGIYQRRHVDDAVHFANGALLAGIVGTLASPRSRTAWEAGAFAATVGVATAALWEMFEWIALKLGARGMDLSYDDTMADLIETSAGALLGGAITLLRHPTRLRRIPGRSGDRIVQPIA